MALAAQTEQAGALAARLDMAFVENRRDRESRDLGFDLRGYDVSADGQRFLMIKDAAPSGQTSTAPSASMVVVLNWTEELKARVPGR